MRGSCNALCVELLNQSKGDERIRGTSLLCKSRIPLHRLELKTHYEVKGFSFLFFRKKRTFWTKVGSARCFDVRGLAASFARALGSENNFPRPRPSSPPVAVAVRDFV